MSVFFQWQRAGIHLVALSIGWVSLSVLIGLFRSFEILETSRELEAGTAFIEAIKIACVWILIGGLIFGTPLFLFVRRKISIKNPDVLTTENGPER